MKFMAIWEAGPESRDQAVARFKETGGGAPKGVKMLGRWHDVSGNAGFALGETDDPALIHRWVSEWNDLLSFEVVTVIDDEEFVRSLA